MGETFFKTDAPAGGNFYGCTSTNMWTLAELPAVSGEAGKLLANEGLKALERDRRRHIRGAASIGVQRLQGRAVSGATPSDGNTLK